MSTVEPESKYLPQIVVNLRERLQHGQHVTRILESQLDTAQQNISLLQGQVRLANETIVNLKKHFRETENILSGLLSGDVVNSRSLLNNASDDRKCSSPEDVSPTNLSKQANVSVDSTTQSPRPDVSADRSKISDEKVDRVKSPFAQQLRQVLDVLEEEPRKPTVVHQPESISKASNTCACADCQPSGHKKQYVEVHAKECGCGSSTCDTSRYQATRQNDYRPIKSHLNGHVVSSASESSVSYVIGRGDSSHGPGAYTSHCSGPCCSSGSHPGTSYKMEKNSSGALHYVGLHSSSLHRISENSGKHESGHHQLPGHCGEKCQCHAFVNYAPYGYHIVESSPGVAESIQPISPTSRRKRSNIPLLSCDEPPHLKYTKVKRVDGNKLSAQKTLQGFRVDFSKRRYLPYNPRYDLDLLIVPPPIPALDLLKGSAKSDGDSPKFSPEVLHKFSSQISTAVSMVNLIPNPSSGKRIVPSNVGMYGFKPPFSALPSIKEERPDCQYSEPSSSGSIMEIQSTVSDISCAYQAGDNNAALVSSSQEISIASCL